MTKRTITVGKALGLQRTSTPARVFNIVALDHQDALREILRPDDPLGLTAQEMSEFKIDAMEAFQDGISGVLLDPLYGVGQIVRAGVLGSVGLLIALEEMSFQMQPLPLDIPFREGWDVAKSHRSGADGVKLFAYYHPDAPGDHNARQIERTRRVVADCAAHDLPFFFEPVLFSPNGSASAAYTQDRPRAAIEMVKQVTPLGAEVLKLGFPVDVRHETNKAVWEKACAAVTEACTVPWVLLSAAVDHETFCDQLEIACKAGAAGYLAGRSVWGDACKLPDRESRRRWLMTEGRGRVEQMAEITAKYGSPWTDYLEVAPVDDTWFAAY